MAKTKKRNRNKPQKKYSLPQLIQQAGQALDNRKYREAVSLYKQLLKRTEGDSEQQQLWRNTLAEAYAGRAAELAAKSMVQEALTLWQQRAKICDKPLISIEYLGWLLHLGNSKQVFELYLQQQDELEALQQLGGIRRRLAALLLGSEESEVREWLSRLDENDPLKSGYAAAFEALQGYCSGHESAMLDTLSKISFRSPYRDLRTILKGELHKIAADTPFYPLANLLQLSASDRLELPQALKRVDNRALEWLSKLRGWSKQQQQMVTKWKLLGDSPKEEAMLQFLSNYRSLNLPYAQQGALTLIILQHKLAQQYERLFGPLKRHQIEWLAALEVEHLRYPAYETEAYWRDYLEQIPPGEEHNLKRALVLNHIIEQAEHYYQGIPEHIFNREGKKQLVENIQQALEFDGNDLLGWVKLIRWQRELNLLKQARASIESAFQHFPQHVTLLEEAAETAISSNAHKKASRYAKQILELDPVNQRVKRLLFESHRSHARKQLEKRMLSPCEKELEQAAAWASDPVQLGRLALARANLYSQLKKPYTQWIEQAQKQLGDGVTLRFMMHQESYSDHPITLSPAEAVTSLDDLLVLSQLINEKIDHWYRNKGDRWELASLFDQILLPYQKILQQAAQLPQLTAQHFTTLCALWLREELEELELALPYAEAALERWPEHRLLLCYRLLAEEKENGAAPHEVVPLLEEAREQKDERVVQLLMDHFPMLHSMGNPHSPDTSPWDDIDEDDEEALIDEIPPHLDNVMKELIEQIPLGQLISMLSTSLSFSQQREFNQMLADMRRKTAGDDTQFKILLLSLLEDDGKGMIEQILGKDSWR